MVLGSLPALSRHVRRLHRGTSGQASRKSGKAAEGGVDIGNEDKAGQASGKMSAGGVASGDKDKTKRASGKMSAGSVVSGAKDKTGQGKRATLHRAARMGVYYGHDNWD